jgi:uncharacterized protein Yka (UPF0111/DUF47 family)
LISLTEAAKPRFIKLWSNFIIMIHGMSVDTARRYIKTIEEIEKIVDKIHAIAYLMGAFSEIEEGAIEIKSSVVGYLGKKIANDVLKIIELLDDHFMSRAAIVLELEALKDDE